MVTKLINTIVSRLSALSSLLIHTGLPLLYMGALTLPLGFARTDHYRKYHPYDYGYEQA